MTPGWAERARAMADQLRAAGDVRSAEWHDALAAVPRHVFVPRVWVQGPDLSWTAVDTGAPPGLDLVYSPVSLVTKLDGGIAVSSSTKPDLMIRMLERLDVREGHTVLEIGTGSGYNAALLSHRLGAERVTSVEVDPELVPLARDRLASLGFAPALVEADGQDGHPGRAPYDRMIATCSVPRVPEAWPRQLADGGLLLVTVMPSQTSGNLAVLERHGDRLEGRFSARPVSFMTMRHAGAPRARTTAPRGGSVVRRATRAPDAPWRACPPAWFWASLRVPGLGHGFVLDVERRAPTATLVTAADGSRAEVELGEGPRTVTESGPTALWQLVEEEWTRWQALGEPGWERLGLTVTPQRQWVWLDGASGPHRWPLV
jgi:protein-L-isoaspartate(D-aspartate) O-methyltransferase